MKPNRTVHELVRNTLQAHIRLYFYCATTRSRKLTISPKNRANLGNFALFDHQIFFLLLFGSEARWLVMGLNIFFAIELPEAPLIFFPLCSILRSQDIFEQLTFFLPIWTTPEFHQATRFPCLIKNKVSRIHSSREIVIAVASKPMFSQPSLSLRHTARQHRCVVGQRELQRKRPRALMSSLLLSNPLCFLSAFASPRFCFFPCQTLECPAPLPALASFVVVNDFALSVCSKRKHCGSIRITISSSIVPWNNKNQQLEDLQKTILNQTRETYINPVDSFDGVKSSFFFLFPVIFRC
jgi:hypothetical protein